MLDLDELFEVWQALSVFGPLIFLSLLVILKFFENVLFWALNSFSQWLKVKFKLTC